MRAPDATRTFGDGSWARRGALRPPQGATRSAACCALAALLAVLFAPPPASGQAAESFDGVWVLDPARKTALDVYGEMRIVDASDDAVRLTMIDYGSAWIEGSFRGVVRLVPWTFPFGRWAPRRGGEESRQPLARARSLGDGVVLAKRTEYGNGDFVWVWSVGGAGDELLHRETDRTWDADFSVRPPEGIRSYFLRASGQDSTRAGSLPGRLAGLAEIIPLVDEIQLRVSPDAATLLVTCPRQECRIVELESGVRVSERPLPRGEVGVIAAHSEAIVEPIP
jgi:hypothetical protein